MEQPRIIQPNPSLTKFVNYFWSFDTKEPGTENIVFRILADGLPGLLFQHYGGTSSLKDLDGSKLPTSFVYGQATTSFTNFSQGQLSVTGVSLKPESLPWLFRTDATEFTNKLFSLNELAVYNVNDRLLNALNLEERIDIISAFLLSNTNLKTDTDAVVADSISRMNRSATPLRLSSLHRYYQISERHFERKFKSSVGIRPLQYLRILKFQKAICQMQVLSPQKLSAIGYDLEYADQSHFIRDFKEFSGFSPEEFRQQNLKYTDFQHDGFLNLPKRLVRYN
jgi:AraC-like DNA-binding protein